MGDIEKLLEKRARLNEVRQELDKRIRAEQRIRAQAEARERTKALLEISAFIFSNEHRDMYGADWQRFLEMMRGDPRQAMQELRRLADEMLKAGGTQTA